MPSCIFCNRRRGVSKFVDHKELHFQWKANCGSQCGILTDCFGSYCILLVFVNYRSLAKKGETVERAPTPLFGRLVRCSAHGPFNHERAPMSCLQQLETLESNNWTQNNIQWNHQQLRSRVLMAHNTLDSMM